MAAQGFSYMFHRVEELVWQAASLLLPNVALLFTLVVVVYTNFHSRADTISAGARIVDTLSGKLGTVTDIRDGIVGINWDDGGFCGGPWKSHFQICPINEVMPVVINSIGGEVCRLPNAESMWSVEMVKDKLASIAHTPLKQQRLLLGTVELDDTALLGVVFASGEVPRILTLVRRSLEQVRWLELVRFQGHRLQDADELIRSDREIVLAATASDSRAFQFASEDLKADRDVVMTAVSLSYFRGRGLPLSFACGDLRGDIDFLHEVVQKCPLAIRYADFELRSYRPLVCEAVREDGYALEFASPELQADEDLVLLAVSKKGNWVGMFRFAAWHLRSNREFVLRVLERNKGELRYVAPELLSDRALVSAAIRMRCTGLEHIAAELRGDRDFVLPLVQEGVLSLGLVTDNLRADYDIVLAAVRHRGCDLFLAADALKNDRNVVMEAIQQSGEAVVYASESLSADEDVARSAALQGGFEYTHRYHGDTSIALGAIRRGGFDFEHVTPELKRSRHFTKKAIWQNCDAYHFMEPCFEHDIGLICIRGCSLLLSLAAKLFLRDFSELSRLSGNHARFLFSDLWHALVLRCRLQGSHGTH